jgi:hypothetical protein
MAKEVETITRQRHVNRHDVAEYKEKGWKFVKDIGTQSALMEKVEKVKAEVVPSVPAEKKEKKPEA